MGKEAFIRILETIRIYATKEFDGVYTSKAVLDELVDELKKAIHCDEYRPASEELENANS